VLLGKGWIKDERELMRNPLANVQPLPPTLGCHDVPHPPAGASRQNYYQEAIACLGIMAALRLVDDREVRHEHLDVCPEGAITPKYLEPRHLYAVWPEHCTGCGDCLEYCPAPGALVQSVGSYRAVFGAISSLPGAPDPPGRAAGALSFTQTAFSSRLAAEYRQHAVPVPYGGASFDGIGFNEHHTSLWVDDFSQLTARRCRSAAYEAAHYGNSPSTIRWAAEELAMPVVSAMGAHLGLCAVSREYVAYGVDSNLRPF
jgi:ferredoxin